MAQGMGMFGPALEDVRAVINEENRPQYSDDFLKASSALGRQSSYGLAEEFGGGDPRIMKAKKIKTIVDELRQEGVSMSDPAEFYPAMIAKLSAAGLNTEADAMATRFRTEAMDTAVKRATIGKTNAEAYKAMREKDPEFVRLQRAYREANEAGRPEEAKQIAEKLAEMSSGPLYKGEEGVGDQVSDVFVDKHGNRVTSLAPRKKGPLVSMGSPEGKGTEVIASRNADSIKQVQGDMRIYQEMAPAMTQIEKIMASGGVNTGLTGDMKTMMQRALSAAGLLSEKDKDTLSNSQLLQKYTTDLVLPKMQALGGQDSNQELTTLMKSVINSGFEPETINRMLDAYRKHSKRVGMKYKKIGNLTAEEIGKKFLNLEDYTEEDAQLAAEEAAKQGGKPVVNEPKKPTVKFPRKGPVMNPDGTYNLDEYKYRMENADPPISPKQQAININELEKVNAKILAKGKK